MLSASHARTIALTVVVSIALVVLALTFATTVSARSSAVCAEDNACWNWATMGNHRRGIVTVYGTPMVVGPCKFQRYMRASLIDYSRSRRMHGDTTAMKVRCPA